MVKIKYEENQKVGELVFVKETETQKGYRRADFKCPLCNEVFNTRIADAKHLKATKCKKCRYDSLKTDVVVKRLLGIRKNMVQRCYNAKNISFKNYGERGISICDEWKNTSKTFVEWALANGYKEGLTIERIDVNGNYEPSNCTWIPKAKQAENKRDNRKYKYIGVSPHNSGFVARVTINGKTKYIGWSKSEVEVALARDNYILKHGLKRKLNF